MYPKIFRPHHRRVRGLAAACTMAWLTALAAPAASVAQATVAGVVVDSLTHHPLAGATVQLVPQGASGGAPRGVDADSAGTFRFTGVAPGRYLLGFVHERLDSLGIEPPVRAVDVASGVTELRADLAVPSARTIAAAICGERHDSTGVLVGRVLDAERGEAVADGAVTVQWGELRVGAGGVRRVTPSLRAPVGPGGRFAACGVPLGLSVLVRATAGPAQHATAASGTIELLVDPTAPFARRDLLVAAVASPTGSPTASPAATDARVDSTTTTAAVPVTASVRRGTARLVGRVRRPDGSALAGARVVVRGAGAADSVAVTDSTGAYRLGDLPAGTYPVEAIAIGFTPARAAADLRPGQGATLDFAVGARVAALQSVNVYAARRREVSAFEERMRHSSGFGRFVTAEDIAKRVPLTIADALVMTPGVHVSNSMTTGRPQILGRGECSPEVYLDGTRIPNGAKTIDELVSPTEVGGIEVYPDANWAPPEYGRMYGRDFCAVVLIWTKGALR
ncbi:MAG TPA: carboxypeptidase regulatory-like domain-containing protein [Gemmatirosa sp.]